jgi:hypothetical protein
MEYKDFLEAHKHLTIEDVNRAIPNIPTKTRNTLAQGPIPYRWDCNVCQAFGTGSNQIVKYETFSLEELIVWIYHEIPKVNFKWKDQNFYGQGADEIYKRCIETYRAAGWLGDAAEPNASRLLKPFHE